MISDKDALFDYLLHNFMDGNHKFILELINEGVDTNSKIAVKSKLSTPLVSYYLNGNKKTKGLFELGLITRRLNEYNKPTGIILTDFGREILKELK